MPRPKKILLECQDIIIKTLYNYEQKRKLQDNPTAEIPNDSGYFTKQKDLAHLCVEKLGCKERIALKALEDLRCGTDQIRSDYDNCDEYDETMYHHPPFVYKDEKTKVFHLAEYAYGRYAFTEDNTNGSLDHNPENLLPVSATITPLPHSDTLYLQLPAAIAKDAVDIINTAFPRKDVQAFTVAPNLILCLEIALNHPSDFGSDNHIAREASLLYRVTNILKERGYSIGNIYENQTTIDGLSHDELIDRQLLDAEKQHLSGETPAYTDGNLNLRKKK